MLAGSKCLPVVEVESADGRQLADSRSSDGQRKAHSLVSSGWEGGVTGPLGTSVSKVRSRPRETSSARSVRR